MALTPTEAGPALRSGATCGTSETLVLPACSGACETPATSLTLDGSSEFGASNLLRGLTHFISDPSQTQ